MGTMKRGVWRAVSVWIAACLDRGSRILASRHLHPRSERATRGSSCSCSTMREGGARVSDLAVAEGGFGEEIGLLASAIIAGRRGVATARSSGPSYPIVINHHLVFVDIPVPPLLAVFTPCFWFSLCKGWPATSSLGYAVRNLRSLRLGFSSDILADSAAVALQERPYPLSHGL